MRNARQVIPKINARDFNNRIVSSNVIFKLEKGLDQLRNSLDAAFGMLVYGPEHILLKVVYIIL